LKWEEDIMVSYYKYHCGIKCEVEIPETDLRRMPSKNPPPAEALFKEIIQDLCE
jgi:hypothetical protein